MWTADGNKVGRREYSLVMNSLRTIGKKVDNPENHSWVNVEFQKFVCYEVRLYGIEGRRNVDEDNSGGKMYLFFKISIYALCERVRQSECCIFGASVVLICEIAWV